MTVELRRFSDRDAWRDAVVERVRAQINEGMNSRGIASMVVSGGSTPEPIFRSLNAAGLPWDRLHVTLADERWVGPDDPASNQRLVMQTLLAGVPGNDVHFYPLWRQSGSSRDAVEELSRSIQAMPRPFDLVMLGMGNDGHTASLFPNQPETQAGMEAERICVANQAPVEPCERISLGLGALSDAREILIPITGMEKLAVYERALEAGPALDLPIRSVLRQQKTPVTVYWSP